MDERALEHVFEGKQESKYEMKTVVKPSQWSVIPKNGELSMQVVALSEYNELVLKQLKTDEHYRQIRHAWTRRQLEKTEEYKKLLEKCPEWSQFSAAYMQQLHHSFKHYKIFGKPGKKKLTENVITFLTERKRMKKTFDETYLEHAVKNIDVKKMRVFKMAYRDCSLNEEQFVETVITSHCSTEIIREVYRKLVELSTTLPTIEENKPVLQRSRNKKKPFRVVEEKTDDAEPVLNLDATFVPTDGWTTTEKINALLDKLHPPAPTSQQIISHAPEMSANENQKPQSLDTRKRKLSETGFDKMKNLNANCASKFKKTKMGDKKPQYKVPHNSPTTSTRSAFCQENFKANK